MRLLYTPLPNRLGKIRCVPHSGDLIFKITIYIENHFTNKKVLFVEFLSKKAFQKNTAKMIRSLNEGKLS